eukprot:15471363-Alexandrium_andersonii.AAC.1
MGLCFTWPTRSQLCTTPAGAVPGEARKSTSTAYDDPAWLDAISTVPARSVLRTVDMSSAAAR